MKITLYREIISLLRKALKLRPESAWIPLYAASRLAAFGYDAQIIDASEYLKVIEYCKTWNCRAANREKHLHFGLKKRDMSHG